MTVETLQPGDRVTLYCAKAARGPVAIEAEYLGTLRRCLYAFRNGMVTLVLTLQEDGTLRDDMGRVIVLREPEMRERWG